MPRHNNLLKQVIRYGIVGMLNNLLSYFIYLVLTWKWMDPKVTVTLLYPICALLAYFAHAKYSFSYLGGGNKSFFRFVIAHIVGYSVNILMLFLLVDICDYPHQMVQVLSIVVVAGLLFFLSRYYIFR
jgi:putative flippase GtrA